MNKRIEVVLKDMSMPHSLTQFTVPYAVNEEYYYEKLHDEEYQNIYLDHEISSEELNKALRIITTYFMQKGNYMIMADLDEMNSSLAPTKEMTLEEIEKELGYKVKVVNEKQDK